MSFSRNELLSVLREFAAPYADGVDQCHMPDKEDVIVRQCVVASRAQLRRMGLDLTAQILRLAALDDHDHDDDDAATTRCGIDAGRRVFAPETQEPEWNSPKTDGRQLSIPETAAMDEDKPLSAEKEWQHPLPVDKTCAGPMPGESPSLLSLSRIKLELTELPSEADTKVVQSPGAQTTKRAIIEDDEDDFLPATKRGKDVPKGGKHVRKGDKHGKVKVTNAFGVQMGPIWHSQIDRQKRMKQAKVNDFVGQKGRESDLERAKRLSVATAKEEEASRLQREANGCQKDDLEDSFDRVHSPRKRAMLAAPDFDHVGDVVRGQRERRQLLKGHDCAECNAFWAGQNGAMVDKCSRYASAL